MAIWIIFQIVGFQGLGKQDLRPKNRTSGEPRLSRCGLAVDGRKGGQVVGRDDPVTINIGPCKFSSFFCPLPFSCVPFPPPVHWGLALSLRNGRKFPNFISNNSEKALLLTSLFCLRSVGFCWSPCNISQCCPDEQRRMYSTVGPLTR